MWLKKTSRNSNYLRKLIFSEEKRANYEFSGYEENDTDEIIINNQRNQEEYSVSEGFLGTIDSSSTLGLCLRSGNPQTNKAIQ